MLVRPLLIFSGLLSLFYTPVVDIQGPSKIKVFLSPVDAHHVYSIRDYGINETVATRNDKLNWFN
jgi:hypothetical protein